MHTRFAILSVQLFMICSHALAQSPGGRGAAASNTRHIVYGDVKVEQGGGGTDKPISLEIILFNEYGNAFARQRIQSNGRYRFIDIPDGRYYIVVEYEGTELERFIVDFSSQFKSDMQRDIELQAHALSEATKAAVIAAADRYNRGSKASSLLARHRMLPKTRSMTRRQHCFVS